MGWRGERLLLKAEKPLFKFQPTEREVVVDGQKDIIFKTVVFRDNFNNTSSGWDEDIGCGYVNDAQDPYYGIEVASSYNRQVTAPVKSSSCYTIEATMYPSYQGWNQDGKYGLIFNMRTFDGVYNVFRVDFLAGSFELLEFSNKKPNRLIYSGTNAAITDHTNRLSVIQNGSEVDLSINGVPVADEIPVYDHGEDSLQVGLYAVSKTGTFSASYDDFVLTSLGLRLLPDNQFRQLEMMRVISESEAE